MMTLKKYEQAIQLVRKETRSSDLNELCDIFAQILERCEASHMQVLEELLTMYQSASEHNVDISRQAIYDLAMRLK